MNGASLLFVPSAKADPTKTKIPLAKASPTKIANLLFLVGVGGFLRADGGRRVVLLLGAGGAAAGVDVGLEEGGEAGDELGVGGGEVVGFGGVFVEVVELGGGEVFVVLGVAGEAPAAG